MKTVVTVFAGRRVFLNILKIYLDILLERGLITEVHLWNYTRTADDDACVRELCENNRKYKLFIPRNKTGWQWRNYYAHYSDAAGYSDDDLIIKCDDDIVFIDIDRIERYFNEIKDGCLYFPNIVNNDVCAYIQTKHGVHGLLRDVDRDRAKLGYTQPLTDWYRSHEAGVRIHDLFLKDPGAFRIGTEPIPWGSRFSINFFGARYSTIRKMYSLFMQLKIEDEAFFSAVICRIASRANMIVPYFNVVHFAFGPQDPSRLIPRFVPGYLGIAHRFRAGGLKPGSDSDP